MPRKKQLADGGKDFRNFRFQNQNIEKSQKCAYFIVVVLEKWLEQNQQSFGNFRKCSKKVKNSKEAVLKIEVLAKREKRTKRMKGMKNYEKVEKERERTNKDENGRKR